MNLEDEEWVEHALIDFDRKRSISKVLSIDCKDAVPKGNNYVSDMYRLNMKVVLHSGDVVNRSVIYKSMPTSENRKKFVKSSNFDRIEAMMFTEVLPEMEKIRQEKQFGVEPLFPVCYGIRNGLKGYLLEDLAVLGYKMADRTELLDFNHAKLVMHALAQFHALSLALIERGELEVSNFKYNYYVENPTAIGPWILPTLAALSTHIEEKWGGEWFCYGEKIRQFSKTVASKLIEEMTFNEANFNVLLHCDCWLTNMMFRYDTAGIPQNIRLLDFQLCSYNSVAVDLQLFLYSSLNADAMKRIPELLHFYHETLVSSLVLYGYSGSMPTFEHVMDTYNRASTMGVGVGLGFVPFIIQPQECVPEDLEQWTQNIVNEKGLTSPSFDSEILRSVLELILKHGSSLGIL